MSRLRVLNPVGKPVDVKEGVSFSFLDTLNGKTVCEMWNGNFEGPTSFRIIREMLQKRYPGVKVIPHTELPISTVQSLSAQNKKQTLETLRAKMIEKGCDAVITGNGG